MTQNQTTVKRISISSDRHNLRYRDSVARRVSISIPQPILIMRAEPQKTLVVDGYQACGWAEPLSTNKARIA